MKYKNITHVCNYAIKTFWATFCRNIFGGPKTTIQFFKRTSAALSASVRGVGFVIAQWVKASKMTTYRLFPSEREFIWLLHPYLQDKKHLQRFQQFLIVEHPSYQIGKVYHWDIKGNLWLISESRLFIDPGERKRSLNKLYVLSCPFWPKKSS